MEVKKMKKLLIMLVCMTLLAGCGQDKKKETNQNSTDNNNVTDTNDTTQQNMSWYDRFESGLKDKNIAYTAKTSIDASTIGGVEGYRYSTENGDIDVYKYEDGDDFNKIMREKKINLNGTSKNVEVNDHYVIVRDGLSDDIVNIFKGLK